MNRSFLRGILVEESFAYGFTIAFWGSGLLLINEFGSLSTLGILKYAAGAITGFGTLAVLTFGGAINPVSIDSRPSYHVLAIIHYLAALVPIGIAHFLIEAPLAKGSTIFMTGMLASVCYNVLVTLEETISEVLWQFEQQYLNDGTGP